MSIISKIYENHVEKTWYESSNIYYSEYNDENNELIIIFKKNGYKYIYPNVDINDYLLFREGGLEGSQGKAFNKLIKKYQHSDKELINLSDYEVQYNNDRVVLNSLDKDYANLLQNILDNGVVKSDRTGTGTKSVFGTQLRINLKEGFPLLTGKKMYSKGIIHELIWFLRGDTNIKYLVDNNCNIWNDDAYRFYTHQYFYGESGDYNYNLSKEDFIEEIIKHNFSIPVSHDYHLGDLGPVYGKQWRCWGEQKIDQIKNVVNTLLTNPDDRRMIISGWNVSDLDDMALPPCHMSIQFYTKVNDYGKRELSCSWYQRSVDSFLGLPFNIASYALLTHIIAKECDMEVGELIFNGGDTHIYLNHIDIANEFISRVNEKVYELPILEITEDFNNINITNIESCRNLNINMFKINNYQSHPILKGELSVGE